LCSQGLQPTIHFNAEQYMHEWHREDDEDLVLNVASTHIGHLYRLYRPQEEQ
jgi:hypothetical protein